MKTWFLINEYNLNDFFYPVVYTILDSFTQDESNTTEHQLLTLKPMYFLKSWQF